MSSFAGIKASQFRENLTKDPEAIVIDVRSKKEYDKEHLTGAIHIPFTDMDALSNLDIGKSYYLYCRVGGKSSVVAHQLSRLGYEKVFYAKSTFKELHSLTD